MKTIKSLVEFAEAIEAGKTVFHIKSGIEIPLDEYVMSYFIDSIKAGDLGIKTDPVTLYEYKLVGGEFIWSAYRNLTFVGDTDVEATGESGVLT